jgi:low affinity Fe/Cu permease
MIHHRIQRLTTDLQSRWRASWLILMVGIVAVAGAVSGVLFGFSATWLWVFSTVMPILIVLALAIILHIQQQETIAILQQLDTCNGLLKERYAGRIAQEPSPDNALPRPLDLPPYVASAPSEHSQMNN